MDHGPAPPAMLRSETVAYRGLPLACLSCRSEMAEDVHLDVGLLRCPSCFSVWIHPSALRTLWDKMGPRRAFSFFREPARKVDRGCLMCNRVMLPVALPIDVPVEWCEPHGVWLDTDKLGVALAAAYLDPDEWWRTFQKLVRSPT